VAQVGIRELLEAGVHFGHQTRRWNPKMRRFIHGENGGIYIIDLLKTEAMLEQAQRFAADVAHRGGTVLFVGTKKQARDSVKEIAEAAGQPYVNHRWLGGLPRSVLAMRAAARPRPGAPGQAGHPVRPRQPRPHATGDRACTKERGGRPAWPSSP